MFLRILLLKTGATNDLTGIVGPQSQPLRQGMAPACANSTMPEFLSPPAQPGPSQMRERLAMNSEWSEAGRRR